MPGSIKKAVALNTLVLLLPIAANAETNMQDAVDETETTTENTAGQSKKPGYHAAGFRIRPSVSVTGKFDDNIFATDSDEESDFITVISPRLNVDSTWDKHSLRFKVGADVGRYGDFDAENYDDFWLTADGKYNLTATTDIFGGLGYGSEHEGRDSPDAVLGGLYPTTYESRNGYVGIKTLQNSTTYRIGLTYEDLDFDDVLDAAGGSIINDDRDRFMENITVNVEILK